MLQLSFNPCRSDLFVSSGASFGTTLTCFLFVSLCAMGLSGDVVRAQWDGVSNSRIKILNLLRGKSEDDSKLAKALSAGVSAALQNIAFTSARGEEIDLVELREEEFNDLDAAISSRIENDGDIIAILGPFHDEDTTIALNNRAVVNHNILCFSPYGASMKLRQWTPHALFTRAGPEPQLMLLMKYVVEKLIVKRFGIMYLKDADYGKLESDLVQALLYKSDHEVKTFYYIEDYGSQFNEVAFKKFAQNKPQAIIVLGQSSPHTNEFIKHCLETDETSDAVLLGTSVQQLTLTDIYKQFRTRNPGKARDGQVVTGGSNLLALDSVYKHILEFRKQMTAYHATTGEGMNFSNDNMEEYMERFTEAEFMITGWIAGTMLGEVLANDIRVKDRKSFQDRFFAQRQFLVYDDFVVGDYGGNCTGFAQVQGAMCECNQGGHTVYLKKYLVQSETAERIEGYNQTYPSTSCYPDPSEPLISLVLLSLNIKGYQYLLDATKLFEDISQTAIRYSYHNFSLPFGVTIRTIDVSPGNVSEGVLEFMNDYHLSIISGPTTVEMPENLPMINPIFPRPRLNKFLHNTTISIMPTLEQQFFVLIQYLSDNVTKHKVASTELTAVVRGLTTKESDAILETLDATAYTFNYELPRKIRMSDADVLTSGIAAHGYTLVVGFDADDVGRLAKHLEENPESCVVLSYQDFSMYYESIAKTFNNTHASVQRRLLTMTNLPLWADHSAEAMKASRILAEFITVFKGDKTVSFTPLGLELFVTYSLLVELMSQVKDNDRLIDQIYTGGIFLLKGDMPFGPYTRSSNFNSSGLNYSRCDGKNYGARNIYVLSMERVFNSSVPNDYGPITPDIVYKRAFKEGTTSRTHVEIAVGCGVAVLAFVLAFLLYLGWFFYIRNRRNRNAPKDMSRPVTLVFTDIESSTALWAMLPQLMPSFVEAHHALIRRAISKHRCYEVKTVGDSFMIACKDAYAAVQLAGEIQQRLFQHRWGTDELESAYRGFEMRCRDECIGYKPPTATLSSEEYSALWRGLRVRIGIHTGICDIRHDSVTGRIDYYGETSNMAARAETIGNGGQVLLTEWTWWSLSETERASLECESLGPQRLRGVPYAVELYQLNSIPGRRYAELRTDFDVVLRSDDRSDTSNDASALSSSGGTITGPAAAIAAVLTNCFSPFSVVQRTKGLEPLLRKWNIATPQRSLRINQEDYCQALINRLAIKMSSVAQMRERFAGHTALSHTSDRHETEELNTQLITAVMQEKQGSPARKLSGSKSNPLKFENLFRLQDLQDMAWIGHIDRDTALAGEYGSAKKAPSSDNEAGSISGNISPRSSESVVTVVVPAPLILDNV